MELLHLDFETYCDLDLKKVGAYRYCEHHSFEILIAHVRGELWAETATGSSSIKRRMKAHIITGTLIVAHNAEFEQLCLKHGCDIDLPPERFIDTMALCSYFSLPRSLEKAALALGVQEQKDPKGKNLIAWFCKPRNPSKNDPTTRRMPKDHPVKFRRLIYYCVQDVKTAIAVFNKLMNYGGLPKSEQQIWVNTININAKGIPINIPLVKKLVADIAKYKEGLVAECEELIGLRPSQGVRLLEWLKESGVKIKALDKDAVNDALLLEQRMSHKARRVLEIKQTLGRTSVAKLDKMVLTAGEDNRVKGTFMYYGTGPGRWSAKGMQPQNFPRLFIKDSLALVSSLTAEEISLIYNPMDVYTASIRSMVQAPEGKTFLVADYSGIELMIAIWACEEQGKINLADKNVCLYKEMAKIIYSVEEVTEEQRNVAKTVCLAGIYGIGKNQLLTKYEQYGIQADEELVKGIIKDFREEYGNVVATWYRFDDAARSTILKKSPHSNFSITPDEKFLRMQLPSGRYISFPDPKIETVRKPWGLTEAITYWGRPKGKGANCPNWVRRDTWGGDLFQSWDQGVGRDLAANGTQNALDAGFPVVSLVHDEIVAEVEEAGPDLHADWVKKFRETICRLPKWAKGLPLSAKGFISKEYKKG